MLFLLAFLVFHFLTLCTWRMKFLWFSVLLQRRGVDWSSEKAVKAQEDRKPSQDPIRLLENLCHDESHPGPAVYPGCCIGVYTRSLEGQLWQPFCAK